MKAVSWNVNGLRACVGKGFEEIFAQMDADLFALQETKLQEDIKPLVYILENDFNEKTLAEGKAAVSAVYGYPCGLEVSGSTDGETVLLAMKIIVSGPEGQISVK